MTIGIMSFLSLSLYFFPFRNLNRLFERYLEPRVRRNCLISSWKSTISAITPTLTSLSNIEPSSRICNTCDTIIQIMMNTSIPINMFIVPDDFITLYVLYSIKATSSMSSMSFRLIMLKSNGILIINN